MGATEKENKRFDKLATAIKDNIAISAPESSAEINNELTSLKEKFNKLKTPEQREANLKKLAETAANTLTRAANSIAANTAITLSAMERDTKKLESQAQIFQKPPKAPQQSSIAKITNTLWGNRGGGRS
jgi:DNA repair ATPase RecN